VYKEIAILPELKLREDLEMDSIMLAELSVRVEDEFGLDVFENGMIYTVSDILAFIDKL
jgi:acyl carrier protein